jgi:hypothetical protein
LTFASQVPNAEGMVTQVTIDLAFIFSSYAGTLLGFAGTRQRPAQQEARDLCPSDAALVLSPRQGILKAQWIPNQAMDLDVTGRRFREIWLIAEGKGLLRDPRRETSSNSFIDMV